MRPRRGRAVERPGVVSDHVVELGDADLVGAAQASPRALDILYLRFRDRIFTYCYYRLGDRDDAENAASSIFLSTLRALPTFRDRDGSFRTWLFCIAHNEVADRHKRRNRRPESPLATLNAVADPGRSREELAVGAGYEGRGSVR